MKKNKLKVGYLDLPFDGVVNKVEFVPVLLFYYHIDGVCSICSVVGLN